MDRSMILSIRRAYAGSRGGGARLACVIIEFQEQRVAAVPSDPAKAEKGR